MKSFRFNESDGLAAIVRKLNEFAKAVTDAMTGRLTVREHLAMEWIDVTFAGPASSLSFLTTSTVEPMGVAFVYLRNTATNAAVALTETFTWTFSGASGTGQIVTTSFSGLSSGNYRARLLVIRE